MSIDVPETGTTLSDRVAEEIRALMARRRVTGRELARRLSVSPAWVSYRLTGHQPIDLNDLDQMARALGVTATSLIPRLMGDTETSHRPLSYRQNRPADRRPAGRPTGNVRPNGQRRTSLVA